MFEGKRLQGSRLLKALLFSGCLVVLVAGGLGGSTAEATRLSTVRPAQMQGGTLTATPTHPLTCTPSWTPTVTATPTGPTVTPTRTGSPTSTRTSTAIPTPGPCVQPIVENFESGTLGIF